MKNIYNPLSFMHEKESNGFGDLTIKNSLKCYVTRWHIEKKWW